MPQDTPGPAPIPLGRPWSTEKQLGFSLAPRTQSRLRRLKLQFCAQGMSDLAPTTDAGLGSAIKNLPRKVSEREIKSANLLQKKLSMDQKDFGEAMTAEFIKSPRGSALGLERTGSFSRTASFSSISEEGPVKSSPATPVLSDLKR